ncbi:MAG: hypothetical protein ACLQBD_10760 [Syntrophobacteraceae bacterium]
MSGLWAYLDLRRWGCPGNIVQSAMLAALGVVNSCCCNGPYEVVAGCLKYRCFSNIEWDFC